MTTKNLIGLCAQYQVSSDSKSDDLFNDASCVLEAVIAQIRDITCQLATGEATLTDEGISKSLFGTLYLAEFAKSALNEGHSRNGWDVSAKEGKA